MTTLHLHNTRTRRKEAFAPLDPANVRMYVCGPTVYDRAHLGNARPVVVFDVLYRLLRHVYGEGHVTYARNFTDVDDKINTRAAETGREIGAITDETIQWFLDDMGELGALEPDQMPRATRYIGQMIAMIEDLIARGHAYEAEGHVLFSVESYPDYGALSGRTVEDMIAGARVEVAPYKRNPMDFILWKPSSGDQPGWDSPWGWGRPGWHIECSAMSHELLGASFDIHGGGGDLMFPHHENEVAQSCCAHPDSSFAQVWMHNEMLQVEGRKMSKSLGNFFTVRDLLDQGIPGEVIRFVMLSTHYRKPMDWTLKKAEEAGETLRNWREKTNDIVPGKCDPEVLSRLTDDLDTSGAISRLHKLFSLGDYDVLRASAEKMGLLTNKLRWVGRFALNNAVAMQLDRVLEVYEEARATKSFQLIDEIKLSLESKGVKLNFSSSGVSIGSINMIALLQRLAKMSQEDKRKVFGDAYSVTDEDGNLQHEALSYEYVASAIKQTFDELNLNAR